MLGAFYRLLQELDHLALIIGVHDPEARRLLGANVHHGDGESGALLLVIAQHGPVIHLVDVIARQHQDGVGPLLAQIIEVAQHGVGGAAVPLLPGARLVGLEQPDPAAGAIEVPRLSDPDVLVEGVRLVLGQHRDVEDARVDAVGEREVDDAIPAGKRHRGLGAHVGENPQTRTGSTCQDHSHNSHARYLS